jgi:hypothetical protein
VESSSSIVWDSRDIGALHAKDKKFEMRQKFQKMDGRNQRFHQQFKPLDIMNAKQISTFKTQSSTTSRPAADVAPPARKLEC